MDCGHRIYIFLLLRQYIDRFSDKLREVVDIQSTAKCCECQELNALKKSAAITRNG